MTDNFEISLHKRVSFATILLGLCFVFLISCDNSRDSDGKHPLFVKAENLYNDGKYDESIPLYQKYLYFKPKSPRTNYRLANIFQQKKDYIRAIFHYEKYLELTPNGSDREVIEKWIKASKESLAKQLLKEYPSVSLADTAKTNMVTRPKSEQPLIVPESASGNIKNEKQPPPARYYTVQEGDNLQKISRKFYGSPKHYKLIIDANKDTLKGSTVLRTGNKIIVPHN